MLGKFLKASHTFTLLAKGSIKAAEKMINPNETVFSAAVVNVSFGETRKATGVLVITDKRAFFCNNVLGAGFTKQLPLNEIQSIERKTGLTGLGQLVIKGLMISFVVDGNKQIFDVIEQALHN